MGKQIKKKKPIDPEGVALAQRRVQQAIRALIKANAALPMSRQMRALYQIEDELWQYATALKGE